MNYKENALCYDDYRRLRESVGWHNYARAQTENALSRSLYTVVAEDANQVVGMGRLIGDGLYYLIIDIVVQPDYQQKGIGCKMIDMLVNFVDKETPVGGRSSIQLIAVKGKEPFYEKKGLSLIHI